MFCYWWLLSKLFIFLPFSNLPELRNNDRVTNCQSNEIFSPKKTVPLDNSLTHKGLHSDDSRITSQIDKSVLQ